MRKRVKRPLAFLTALLMLLTMSGSQVFAEDTVSSDTAAEVQGEAESAEADVLTQGQDDGGGNLVEYVPEEQPEGVSVKAYAAEGALPEGAVMKVTMLDAEGDTADQYDEAAQALEENGVDYAGFLAMDIGFYDAAGNEIEPEDGTVNVQFEMDKSMLPDEAQADTLAVQHLAENGNEIQVETVADAAEKTAGSIAVEDSAVKAEFSVESFSYFTITWGGWNTYFNVKVHYVDENGNPLEKEHDDISVSGVTDYQSQTYRFEDYAEPLEGYSYLEARYSRSENFSDAEPVVRMVASQTWGYLSTTRKLSFYNSESGNSKLLDTLSYSGWDDDTQEAHIYLVYKSDEDSSGDGSTITNATVTTGKTAVLKDDDSGNYDLTLSITGDRGQAGGEDVKVDILFILDESGSMDYRLDRDSDAGGYEDSRMDLLKNAVGSLIDTVEANADIDARYSAVSFSRSQLRDQVNWTNESGVRTFVNALDPNGGTNYQQGIYDGKELLDRAREDALTFVIFVSDGEPTYRGINVYNSTSGTNYGNGSDDNGGKNIAAAVQEISSMECDYFYAIGMGPEFGQDRWGTDKQGTKNLKSLAEAVKAEYTGVYSAQATGELEKAFSEIASNIVFFAAKNVKISDPLSTYAELVLNASGQAEFTITVSNDSNTWQETVISGQSLTFKDSEGNSIKATAKYDSGSRTIILEFPEDYELEEGYLYSVSTVITPSAAAISEGMNSDAAQQTPDSGTGTHSESGEKGFWSNDNDNAKVTFTANGTEGSELFPKPVIQVQEVPTGSLSITKNVAGIDDDDADLVNEQSFTFNVEKLGAAGNTDEDFTDEALGFSNGLKTVTVNGSGVIVIEGLPEGDYRVTENEETIPSAIGDYIFVEKTGENTVSIVKDQTSSITVTNEYKHRDKTLTIIKKVEGNMGNKSDDFKFELTVLNTEGNVLDTAEYEQIAETAKRDETELNNDFSDGKLTFTLQDNQTFTITIPHGYQYTVQEVNNAGYEVNVKVTAGTGTVNNAMAQLSGSITADTSATFTNDRTVDPPTGLIRSSMPFVAMIMIALGAVVLFITGRRIRR